MQVAEWSRIYTCGDPRWCYHCRDRATGWQLKVRANIKDLRWRWIWSIRGETFWVDRNKGCSAVDFRSEPKIRSKRKEAWVISSTLVAKGKIGTHLLFLRLCPTRRLWLWEGNDVLRRNFSSSGVWSKHFLTVQEVWEKIRGAEETTDTVHNCTSNCTYDICRNLTGSNTRSRTCGNSKSGTSHSISKPFETIKYRGRPPVHYTVLVGWWTRLPLTVLPAHKTAVASSEKALHFISHGRSHKKGRYPDWH